METNKGGGKMLEVNICPEFIDIAAGLYCPCLAARICSVSGMFSRPVFAQWGPFTYDYARIYGCLSVDVFTSTRYHISISLLDERVFG